MPVRPISTKGASADQSTLPLLIVVARFANTGPRDGQIKGEERIDQHLQQGILHDAVQPAGEEARRGVEQQRQNDEWRDAE